MYILIPISISSSLARPLVPVNPPSCVQSRFLLGKEKGKQKGKNPSRVATEDYVGVSGSGEDGENGKG